MSRALVFAACAVVVLAASGDARVDDAKYKSASAKKAAEAFHKDVAKFEDKYRKGLEQARADYLKALAEARKEAIKANDLEEAEQLVIAVKALDDAAAAKKVATVRQRVSGSVWAWDGKDTFLTLHADGTVTLSWHKDATGNWYANPDGTVAWWCTKHSFITIMKFNAEFTAHDSFVPALDLKRAGKRVK